MLDQSEKLNEGIILPIDEVNAFNHISFRLEPHYYCWHVRSDQLYSSGGIFETQLNG